MPESLPYIRERASHVASAFISFHFCHLNRSRRIYTKGFLKHFSMPPPQWLSVLRLLVYQ